MRTFKNIGNGKCIICGTSKKGPCILVGIDGTEKDGNEEASPIHVDCIGLRHSKEYNVLYQKLDGWKSKK
jgi:hypothetical protein